MTCKGIGNRPACFLAVFLVVCSAVGATSYPKAQKVKAVSGCELLSHPGRYNDRMVVVKGLSTVGFERDDITFDCPGSVGIQISPNPTTRKKYGFLTEESTMDVMSQLPPGEHPGDNLTKRIQRYALVTVVGLFRCHYDFPTCKGATRNDGSIIVKSMQFDTPMSDTPPALKPRALRGTPRH